ncbi:hypothetical protein U3516DRAFT_862515, partial [Neocallimastix sp. 'constans']
MISLTDTQISSSLSSKENSTSPITIEQKILEKQKNKKNSIRHFHHIDCPTKIKKCQKKHCNINEDLFYLVIFGYSKNNTTYSLYDIEGDFKLKSVELNGKPDHSTLLNYNIFVGKAYKTSFIGMTENDNEPSATKEEEADIFKKMIYIAVIVIPSIIIFLLLLFVYCHHSIKTKPENTDKLYNPEEEEKKLRFKPFMEEQTNGKGKKPHHYFNYDNSSTLHNDSSSKMSILNNHHHHHHHDTNNRHSQSKGASTIYKREDDDDNGNSSIDKGSYSNSIASYPYIDENEVPFKNKESTKKLDLSYPYNRDSSNYAPQANISIPYNMYHYDEALEMKEPKDEEHSEDIVNTSIGHMEGEEFDNTKNIYIKINRSTNKYNTEKFLKEDSINKIKEKHSCIITQLSKFFKDHKDPNVIHDKKTMEKGNKKENKEEIEKDVEIDNNNNNNNNNDNNSSNNSSNNSNASINNNNNNYNYNNVNNNDNTNNDSDKNSNANTHNHSPLPYIPQHPLPHLPSISTNELTNSSSKYINSNITSSSTSSSTNTNTNTNSSSGSDIGSSSGNVIGRLTYTFYYSSNRILNVDEVVKIKKIYDSHWVKVERNPREYFIIPLLVLEAPFEEIRRLKIYSQKYRSKESTTEEELEINDRVEPTPEYLYHCAYISFKDYQKMSYNGRWERKIKTLHHVLPKDSSTITSTTSTTTNNNNNYINNNNNTNVISSSSASSSFSFSSINASVTGSTTSMPVTPYNDSSLDGINMTSSSQDDLVIRENSRTRILNSEEKE